MRKLLEALLSLGKDVFPCDVRSLDQTYPVTMATMAHDSTPRSKEET